MKYFLVALFMSSLLYSPVAKADGLSILVNSLCDFAKSNNRSQLRKKLKQNKVKLKRIYGGITCGSDGGFQGGSLLRIATFNGALGAVKYIVSQIGSSGVKTAESDGKTILEWSKALAASDASKASSLQPIITFYESK